MIVSRSSESIEVTVKSPGANSSQCYTDCYHADQVCTGSAITVHVEAHGIGCVLLHLVDQLPDRAFLATMSNLTAFPLSSFDPQWEYLQQTMVLTQLTPHNATPSGMVKLDGGHFLFVAVCLTLPLSHPHYQYVSHCVTLYCPPTVLYC